ncbi:MAG: hypothetical protein HRT36_04215 [Alphaproteobacteria bacterium]|nr:hypothetical protein [Alphaproteobacteria bacterium]
MLHLILSGKKQYRRWIVTANTSAVIRGMYTSAVANMLSVSPKRCNPVER